MESASQPEILTILAIAGLIACIPPLFWYTAKGAKHHFACENEIKGGPPRWAHLNPLFVLFNHGRSPKSAWHWAKARQHYTRAALLMFVVMGLLIVITVAREGPGL